MSKTKTLQLTTLTCTLLPTKYCYTHIYERFSQNYTNKTLYNTISDLSFHQNNANTLRHRSIYVAISIFKDMNLYSNLITNILNQNG